MGIGDSHLLWQVADSLKFPKRRAFIGWLGLELCPFFSARKQG